MIETYHVDNDVVIGGKKRYFVWPNVSLMVVQLQLKSLPGHYLNVCVVFEKYNAPILLD